MKCKWIGPDGFTPGVGITVKGKIFDIPKDISVEMAKSLEGKLEPVKEGKDK